MEKFAIKSTHWSLIEAFKKEAEKLGWVYNAIFNRFSENDLLLTCDCLYFSSHWQTDHLNPRMALSLNDGAKLYYLPQDWDAALKAININKNVEVTIQEIANWKGVPAELIKIKQ